MTITQTGGTNPGMEAAVDPMSRVVTRRKLRIHKSVHGIHKQKVQMTDQNDTIAAALQAATVSWRPPLTPYRRLQNIMCHK